MSTPTSTTAERCVPAVRDSLDVSAAEEIARRYRALGDATRLRLLTLVASLGLSPATVNHHLKILVEAGPITRESRGTWSYSTIQHHRSDALGTRLLTSAKPA